MKKVFLLFISLAFATTPVFSQQDNQQETIVPIAKKGSYEVIEVLSTSPVPLTPEILRQVEANRQDHSDVVIVIDNIKFLIYSRNKLKIEAK
jgi:hypothetical protein